MKKTAIIVALLIFSVNTGFADSKKEKASYVLGYSVGENFRKNHIDINMDTFIKGLKESLSGKKSAFTEAESKKILIDLRRNISDAILKKNIEAEEDFLASNSLKKGVVQTDSGLQYKILVKGTGKTPTMYDRVKVNYKGTKLSGEVFDSSYSRNEPAVFAISGVIAGWQEALQLMKEGAKWKIFVPSKLAYGNRNAGSIQPGEMLIFEIELINIQ